MPTLDELVRGTTYGARDAASSIPKLIAGILRVFVQLAAGIAAFGQISTNFPEVVSPGETVLIKTKPSGATNKFAISVHPNGDGAPAETVAGKYPPTPPQTDAVEVPLPAKLKPGRYYLTLTETDPSGTPIRTDVTVPGEIRIQNDAVKLDSTHPSTAYRDSTTGLYDFDVIGQNFSVDIPRQNIVSINGQGPIVMKNWGATEKECKDLKIDQLPCLWINDPHIIHVVGYKKEPYQGPLQLNVTVGTAPSQSIPLVLSRMSETAVIFSAVVIFAVLGYILYQMVSGGLQQNVIGGKRLSPFQMFFLDKETNSYSLSKFQFLLFSATFVFGYLYVFLCRWLVQWQFVLPDVPSNFSGILAISAGTTIAATGATAARGSKGAGNPYPSMADFITNGGQVAPERFQFFVWSLVACFGFLALLISQNPATISAFPSFPDGLLYIMGVSSAGYLGGKLTRKPGPIIRSIAYQAANPPDVPNPQIIVQGENLSRALNSEYLIDGKKLEIQPEVQQQLVTSKDQDDAVDRSFASELKVAIAPTAGIDVSAGDHTFRIVNPDGQFAEARFTADMPRIDAVWVDGDNPPAADTRQIPHGDGPIQVRVAGAGFRTGMTARWTPAGATEPIDLAASAVTMTAPQRAILTLTPGAAGNAVLLLTTPNGFAASATVIVA